MDTMSAEELAKWLDEMAQWFAELTADTVGGNNCRAIARILRALKPQSEREAQVRRAVVKRVYGPATTDDMVLLLALLDAERTAQEATRRLARELVAGLEKLRDASRHVHRLRSEDVAVWDALFLAEGDADALLACASEAGLL